MLKKKSQEATQHCLLIARCKSKVVFVFWSCGGDQDGVRVDKEGTDDGDNEMADLRLQTVIALRELHSYYYDFLYYDKGWSYNTDIEFVKCFTPLRFPTFSILISGKKMRKVDVLKIYFEQIVSSLCIDLLQ